MSRKFKSSQSKIIRRRSRSKELRKDSGKSNRSSGSQKMKRVSKKRLMKYSSSKCSFHSSFCSIKRISANHSSSTSSMEECQVFLKVHLEENLLRKRRSTWVKMQLCFISQKELGILSFNKETYLNITKLTALTRLRKKDNMINILCPKINSSFTEQTHRATLMKTKR